MMVPEPVVIDQSPASFVPAVSCAVFPQVSISAPAFTAKLLLEMVTWLVALHASLVTVHSKTLFPALNPETELVANRGLAIEAEPPTTDHEPVPWLGVAALSDAIVLQTVWLLPADELTELLTTTVLLVALQDPRLTVHLKVLFPKARLETGLLAANWLVMIPVPEVTLHDPIPWTGGIAFRLAVPLQLESVAPASAVTELLAMIRSALLLHVLFLTVQVKMFVP